MLEGYTLKMLRAKFDLTQKQAAEKVGVSEATWSNWEASKTFPDAMKIKRIEKEFNISYDNIIFFNPNHGLTV